MPKAGATLERMLADAEELISYLAGTCHCKLTEEEKAASQTIIAARLDGRSAWDKATAGELVSALATLNSRVAPVTVESLRLCRDGTGAVLRRYWIGTVALALAILVLSVASFVTAGMSKSIAADIIDANELAVRLVSQIGVAGEQPRSGSGAPAPRVSLTDLQAFASSTRSIHQRADLLDDLNLLLRATGPRIEHDGLRLPVPLADPGGAASTMIQKYQEVRDHAQLVRGHTELLYGAVGTIVLPILYALIGALANLLRLFSRRVSERSYYPSYTEYAQLLVAAISGMVVGLFSNVVVGHGVSLPPLAIAFVAGYATDFFFGRLDAFLQRSQQPERSLPADSGGAGKGVGK